MSLPKLIMQQNATYIKIGMKSVADDNDNESWNLEAQNFVSLN